jgi:hypothetical protein
VGLLLKCADEIGARESESRERGREGGREGTGAIS